MRIDRNNVNQISVEYKDMDKKKYIIMTEWANGEGCDVSFDDNKSISLSFDEFNALNLAFNYMQLNC